jgi:hypothetical protein
MSTTRSHLGLVAFITTFLAVSGVGHAEVRNLSAELATGVLVLGDGPSPLEAGISVDLSLSTVLGRYFLARAGVGLVPALDRHSLEFYARPRLEAGVRLEVARVVPLLGVGAFTLGRSPAVHALAGVGFQVSSAWQIGLDVRSGVFWDRFAARDGRTRLGEAQLRVGRSFM